MAAKSLSTEQISKIESLIQVWKGKFTWGLLVQRIKVELDIDTTRQTLTTYSRIKTAYSNKKQNNRDKVPDDFLLFTKENIDSYQKIQNLEAEIDVLKSRVDSQLAFIREIGKQSEHNPLLTHLLNKVRDNLSKRQNK